MRVILWLSASLLLLFALGPDGNAAPRGAAAALGSPDFRPSPNQPIGWRGDGTGRYPAATPPTSWERARMGAGYTTKGIRWMTPLPSTGVSCPIIVGDR